MQQIQPEVPKTMRIVIRIEPASKQDNVAGYVIPDYLSLGWFRYNTKDLRAV